MRLALAFVMLAFPALALPVRDALGQIETGCDDHIIGKSGEISRYQIKPEIWALYSESHNFTNEITAWAVAQAILKDRSNLFVRGHNRLPNAFELYVLWNAPAQIEHPSAAVRERATRFVNLINKTK